MNIRDVAEDAELSRREALKGAGLGVAAAGGAHVVAEGAMGQSGGPDDEISGVVEDDNGAVSGAVVEAVPHDDSYDPLETTTASDGSYTFTRSELHDATLLYHVIARDGTETSPRRGEKNYPFISADGTPDIPDSGLLHNYDWSDGSTTTSTVPDLEGSADLTGSFTDLSSTINGTQAGTFDGADDGLDVDFGSTKTQPLEIFSVIESTDDGTNQVPHDGYLNGVQLNLRWDDSTPTYQIFAGSSVTNGSPTTNPIITMFRPDSTNSILEVNGTQKVSGDAGTNDLDGLTAGKRREDVGGGVNFNGAIGQIAVYDPSASGYSRSDVESYLSDKWGITV